MNNEKSRGVAALAVWAGWVCAGWPVDAAAQTYRCFTSGGGSYLSSRPCPTLYVPPPRPPKTEDHVKHLGSGCASISEAIRTGPARGVRGDVIQGLHEEYRQKCALEDQDARKRARDDEQQAMAAKQSERDTARTQRDQAGQRRDQCNGMRDVIALKRKRESQLNEKEVQALRDLERTYNERCL